MRITEIRRRIGSVAEDAPTVFRVGEPVVEGGHVVADILYCRDGYSKGAFGRDPVYAVKFEDVAEVRVIPVAEVVDLAVDPTAKKKGKEDPPPELPE